MYCLFLEPPDTVGVGRRTSCPAASAVHVDFSHGVRYVSGPHHSAITRDLVEHVIGDDNEFGNRCPRGIPVEDKTAARFTFPRCNTGRLTRVLSLPPVHVRCAHSCRRFL